MNVLVLVVAAGLMYVWFFLSFMLFWSNRNIPNNQRYVRHMFIATVVNWLIFWGGAPLPRLGTSFSFRGDAARG